MSAGQIVYPEPDGTGNSLDDWVADFEAELIRRKLDD